MPDTTASIGAKGTDGTGLTEDLAVEMFNRIGHHWMAVVEIQATQPHGPNLKGKRKVDLVITHLEVAEDGSNLEDHLRNLQNTLHYNRGVRSDDAQGSLPIGDGPAPKVADVLAAGAGFAAHDFVLDDSDPERRCEHAGCRKPEDDPIHTLHDDLDPDSEPDEEESDEDDEPDQGEAEDAGSQEPGDADPDTADDSAAVEPGWGDGYPQGQPAATRPLSAVPNPFTSTAG